MSQQLPEIVPQSLEILCDMPIDHAPDPRSVSRSINPGTAAGTAPMIPPAIAYNEATRQAATPLAMYTT